MRHQHLTFTGSDAAVQLSFSGAVNSSTSFMHPSHKKDSLDILPNEFISNGRQDEFHDNSCASKCSQCCFDLNSPCQELKTTVEEQGFEGMIFNYSKKALKYRKFAIESYNDFVIDQCRKRYDYTIQGLLGELEMCVPRRFK